MKTQKCICLACNLELGYNKLKQHLKKHHNLKIDQYKLNFNIQNYCACGCKTTIKDKLKWAKGHHSRVNNISKREDIKELRREKMQEWHDSGKWIPWNKGVSDERTKANGAAVLESRGEEFNTLHL